MLEAERARKDGIDFVVIATPNHLHLPVAKAALEAGFAVVSDKPATATYAEVLELEAVVAKAALPYALTPYLCRVRACAGGARCVRERGAGTDSQGCS